MRIGKKLTLGYVLVALLVAVVGFLGLNAIRAISHPFDDVSRHSVPTIQTVEGLRFAGLRIVSSTSEWALMRSESEARILQRKITNEKGQKPEAEEEEQIQSGRHMYDTLLKRYEELLQDAEETSEGKVLLERIRISGQQLRNNSAQLIELKKARVAGQAILEKKEELEIGETNFLDAVDAAIRLENSEVVSDIATVESRIKTAINTISACGVLTLIVALVTGVWMAGSISKPLTRMKRASAEIGKGKLDSRLNVNSNDEIGELADAFNRMAADLKRSNTEIVSAKNFAANIVRSMADTLIVADTRLFITRVNQATLSLLGYEEHELIGKPLKTVVADLVFGDAGIDELKEAGFNSGVEKTYTRKGGAKVPMLFSGSVLKDEDCEVQGIVCVAHCIAERKQIDDVLRRSEEHFRSLIENASDVITIIDAKGTILYESPSIERVLGMAPQALIGANALDLTHPDDRKTAVALLTAAIGEDGTAGPTEVRFEHADGSWRTLEVIGQVVRDESGAVQVIINCRDVTERKRSEAALRESEEKYRTILESIQEGYYEVDLRGHLTFFNDSLCRIVGTPPDKLKGLNHREYTDPDTARTVFEAFNRVFSTGESIEGLQYQITNLEGVTRFLEVSVSLRRESTGEIAGFRGTIRDVTERLQAELALRESQEHYKTLFESATDAIMILDTEDGRMGRILAANPAAAQHSGYTVEELMNLSVADLQTPEQAEVTSREFRRIVQGEHLCIELLRRRKDGTTFPIEVNAGPLMLGGKRYILSFARDLTQRKHIEKEATMLAHAIRSIQEAVCITDSEDTLLFVNDAFLATYQYERHEVIGKNIFELVRVPATSVRATAIPPPNLNRRWEGELFNRRKDGSEFPIHLSTSPIIHETGRTIALVGVIQDITERKQAEQALRESEKRYRALFESNPQPMWVYSTETLSFLAVNDAAVDTYGYSREDFLAMSIKDIRPQEDVSTLLRSVENAPAGFESSSTWRHRKKDASIIDVEVSSHGLSFVGHKARLVLATDVTERTRATKELQDSELKYRTLFNHIADPVFIFDKATNRFLDCNEAVCRNYGYSVEELRTMSVFDLHPPEDLPKVERYIGVRNPDHPNTYTHITKDARRIDVETLTDEIEYLGRPCWISIVRDVTQRKRTEDRLLRLATAVEQTGDNIVITNTDGDIQYVNPAFEQTTGYSSDEVIGKNPRFLKSGESSIESYRNLWETITQGARWTGHFTNKRKDGSLYEEEATIAPVRDNAGTIVNYVAVKRDITERRKMEKEVTMLAYAIRSIQECVSITDPNDKILFVNEAFLETYGYTHDEVIGKNIRQLARRENEFDHADMPSPESIVSLRWEGELINRRKDGKEFPVQLSASPILDEDGQTIALIGIAQDITERKQAEQALRESELRYKTLFDAASDSIMILDTEGDKVGRILAANCAAAETTGYTAEELLNLNITDLRMPLPASLVRRDIERVLNGDKVTVEILRRRKDGTTFAVEVNQSVLTLGDKYYVLDFARDVTQRKQSEKEVTMLAQAIRSIHEAVVVADPEGHIIFVNAAAVKVYGYEPDEAIGKHVAILHPTSDPREFANEIVSSATAGDWEGEMLSRHKDGTEFPTYLSATAIRDQNGQCTGFIGVSQDITERRHAIEELQKAKEAAETASSAKSEFLANMSHEIRTPMNGIIGMTDLALDTDLTTEQREYLKMVKLSADSLLGVINDVLDFSKIEAGRLGLDPAEFDLQDAVDEVMKALAVRADQKGLELAYYFRPGVPERVVGDVGRLRQILVNLVGNAIKFTERGEVIVRVEAEAQTSEEVVLHFGVRDTGIGIPLEKQMMIFESFTQADGSTTRKYGGTGLGLTISSQLVQMMGGEIWVESPVNLPSSYGTPGSMFHFTSTFARPEESVPLSHPPEMFDLEGLPVLVVDDNATNRRILEVQLTSWHLKPVLADGAPSALRAIKDAASAGAPFKLALLDFHMPEMDGLALAEEIKSAPEGRDLRIIMMSSSVQQNQASPRDCNVDASLLKPVRAAELLSVIRVVLGADARSQIQRRQARRKSAYPSRVLVAEDSTVNQEVIRRLLEKWGHTAVIAGNGLKALSTFDNERFDLVLMDLQMPEMNGFEVTATIRKRENGAGTRIPIIALTAHALKGDRERCIDAGMDDYVSKPIDAEKLFDVIETAASQRGSARVNCEIVQKELDLDGLLRSLDGDSDLVLTLARIFADSSLGQVEQIGDAIARGDAEALARGAHLLKGSVANFGARAAVEAAVQLEGIAKSGDLSIAGAAFATLENEIDTLKRELQRFEQASLL